MGKARLRKKHKGLLEQTRKHIKKFEEAIERGDIGSMEYMAREMSDYLKQIKKIDLRTLPRKKRIKLKRKGKRKRKKIT